MLLRFIALLEWFSTLAVQMVALRMAIPVVGSSVVLTSVYIWVILLALSAGYWIWWVIAERYKHVPKQLALILAGYLLIAGVYYSLISFGMHTSMLEYVLQYSDSYLLTLFIVSTALFVIPVLLASQTIPILTELIPMQSKGHAAGQILFASTIGSFLWSVLTSTILFPSFGVLTTWAITVSIILLAWVLSLRLYSKPWSLWAGVLWVLLSAGLVFWVHATLDPWVLYEWDTAYHTIQIREYQYEGVDVRLMVTNGGFSSARDTQRQQSPFPYIRSLIEQTNELQPAKILLIGTAGFTYPAELQDQLWLERIDAIDIDGAFLDIAEEYVFESKLDEKIVFYPDSARYFLTQAIARWEQYDLVVLDAYNGRFVPAELATVEFFEDIERVCGGSCQVLSNLIIDRDMTSDFSRSIVWAMQSVWPDLWIQKLHRPESSLGNSVIATSYRDEFEYIEQIVIIPPTDDRHQLETQLVEMWWE